MVKEMDKETGKVMGMGMVIAEIKSLILVVE